MLHALKLAPHAFHGVAPHLDLACGTAMTIEAARRVRACQVELLVCARRAARRHACCATACDEARVCCASFVE